MADNTTDKPDGHRWGVPARKQMNYTKEAIRAGDVCRVMLPVSVKMVWSDKIPAEYDPEGNVTDYESGWVMEIVDTGMHVLGQHHELSYLYSTTPST